MTELGSVTLTPEIIVIWDGTNIQDLGIKHLLSSATIGSTVKRKSKTTRQGSTKGKGTSKAPRYYSRRSPHVAGAQLDFIVPNQAYATHLMRLIGRTGKPRIGVGFRAPQLAGGRGIMIGSFKMDTIDWDYSNNGFVKLSLKGKTDVALGIAKFKGPRTFSKKTFKSIVEGIAEEYGLAVGYSDPGDPDLNIELDVFSPSGETDFDFIDRIAEAAGFSGLSLQPDLLSQKNSNPPLNTVVKSEGVVSNTLKEAAGTVRITDPEYLKESGKLSGTLLVSKLPTFLVNSFRNRELPKVALAYGPGVVGQEDHLPKDAVVLKVASMKVTMPQSGGARTSSAKVRSDKQTGSVGVRTPGVRNAQTGEQIASPETTQVRTDISGDVGKAGPSLKNAANSKSASARKASSPSNFLDLNVKGIELRQLPNGSKVERVFLSGCPTSTSNDLSIAKRNGARARYMGYVEEISITLNPGFPFINPPMTVPLFGSYVHDGEYGVEEVTHKYDSSGGLVTELKLLRVRKGGTGKGKGKGKGSKGSVRTRTPGVRDNQTGEVLATQDETEVKTDISGDINRKGSAPVSSTVPTRHPKNETGP